MLALSLSHFKQPYVNRFQWWEHDSDKLPQTMESQIRITMQDNLLSSDHGVFLPRQFGDQLSSLLHHLNLATSWSIILQTNLTIKAMVTTAGIQSPATSNLLSTTITQLLITLLVTVNQLQPSSNQPIRSHKMLCGCEYAINHYAANPLPTVMDGQSAVANY